MQRIGSLSVCRELGGLGAWTPGVRRNPQTRLTRPTRSSSSSSGTRTRQRVQGGGVCAGPVRPLCSLRLVFAGQTHRHLCSKVGDEKSRPSRPDISVVGSPDHITWVRCKVLMFLIRLYFEVDLESVEFERGAKQALVHVSELMSTGRYHRLKGVVSDEMMEYVETKCKALTKAQRQQLTVTTDDIIFLLPEDVSVTFDTYGRKFCFVVMRFWFLTTQEGPEDPEGTKIFKISSSEDGSPQKKIATAVYEFHRELTLGASPDWTVTTVWHWHWIQAETPK
uniref:Si:dkey-82o10.4 n=2 Tax=Sphaeramia orbicularis TaxID=375764 RepID=A0A673B845_9TELE